MQNLIVPAKNDKLEDVIAFIDAFLSERDCPLRIQMAIELSVEEIFVNIANYAYPDGEGEAEIRISETDGVVQIVFLDSGVPYDPLKKPDPDVTLSAEERKIGGLGVYLVKKSMDSVSYLYQNNKNVLTFTKRISPVF